MAFITAFRQPTHAFESGDLNGRIAIVQGAGGVGSSLA